MTCLISSHIHWTVMRVVSGVHMPHCYHSTFGAVRDIVHFFIHSVGCVFFLSMQLLLNSTHSFVLFFLGADEWKSFQLRFSIFLSLSFSIIYGPTIIWYEHGMVYSRLVGENWSWINFLFSIFINNIPAMASANVCV